MPLSTGDRLGPYEILSSIGAGGMGEVYKARDTRLDRVVAIKVSKEQFSERFEREARAVAALNHPNICQLYDVGPNYLVMEFIEGEPLKGPLPLDKAVEYAGQILEALDAAHKKNITHRDLKPANILVTKQGIKLLDFGLAKRTTPLKDTDATLTAALTSEGQIVGTLQYMSPEQLQSKDADARSDIFAFGCVLYELLTGKRAFEGQSSASVIAAILEREPAPLAAAPPLERVVRRTLAKDPDQRFQTARDLKAALHWAIEQPAPSPAAKQRQPWPWITAAVLAVCGVTGWLVAYRATRPVEHPLTRLSVDLGPGALNGLNYTAVISPDGRRLVFPARGPDGKQRLATRVLDQAQPTLLPGTEDGRDPFFSPDGQWIGFFTRAQIKKLSVQGGAPVTLAGLSVGAPGGASWGPNGNIFASLATLAPLSLIPGDGGRPQAITQLGTEVTHRWPQVLPGGAAVLFTGSASAIGMEEANIEVLSLRTGQVKIVQRGGYAGRYLPSGHLVYVHQGVLYGVKFNLENLEALGQPMPLLEDMAANQATGGGQFDISNGGTLLYSAGTGAAQGWQIQWLDSTGSTRPLLAAPDSYGNPRVSPDGTKLTYVRGGDMYLYDLLRDTTSRLTFTGKVNVAAWAPDSKHIVFESVTNGFVFSWMRIDGAGDPQELLKTADNSAPWGFSPDGRRLAYLERRAEAGFDIWTLPLDMSDPDHPKPGKPEPFLRTPADESFPRFSPDGRWIVYRSNEGGNGEIYVRPFPNANGGKWQISVGGGLYAYWSNNGREILYETLDNRIMIVDYKVEGGAFAAGKPRLWSDRQLFFSGTSNLDLAPDGKHFAVFSLPEAAPGAKGSVHVTMLLNFFDELKRRIP